VLATSAERGLCVDEDGEGIVWTTHGTGRGRDFAGRSGGCQGVVVLQPAAQCVATIILASPAAASTGGRAVTILGWGVVRSRVHRAFSGALCALLCRPCGAGSRGAAWDCGGGCDVRQHCWQARCSRLTGAEITKSANADKARAIMSAWVNKMSACVAVFSAAAARYRLWVACLGTPAGRWMPYFGRATVPVLGFR